MLGKPIGDLRSGAPAVDRSLPCHHHAPGHRRRALLPRRSTNRPQTAPFLGHLQQLTALNTSGRVGLVALANCPPTTGASKCARPGVAPLGGHVAGAGGGGDGHAHAWRAASISGSMASAQATWCWLSPSTSRAGRVGMRFHRPVFAPRVPLQAPAAPLRVAISRAAGVRGQADGQPRSASAPPSVLGGDVPTVVRRPAVAVRVEQPCRHRHGSVSCSVSPVRIMRRRYLLPARHDPRCGDAELLRTPIGAGADSPKRSMPHAVHCPV